MSKNKTEMAATQPVKQHRMMILLVVLLLSINAYLGVHIIQLKRTVDTQLTGPLQQATQTITVLQTQITDAITLAENNQVAQTSLNDSVEQLYSDFAKDKSNWIIIQTEQLLTLANQRLLLARDVDAAITALTAADRQLAELKQPGAIPLRALLATKLGEFKALEQPDVTGMALRLGALIGLTDNLPLDIPSQAATQHTSSILENDIGEHHSTTQQIWQDLLSLIRIRRDINVDTPLLTPEQHYFLKENFRLQLLAAKLALLRGEYAIMQDNLAIAAKWLDDYFSADTQVVRYAKDEITALSNTQFITQLPTLADAITFLQDELKTYRTP